MDKASQIEERIHTLFRDIPDSRRKQELMQEIAQDLGDKVDDLIAQGRSAEAAINKAFEDFGDICDISEFLETNAQRVKKNRAGLALAFSVWGTLLIAGLFFFINMYYTPHVIWFVYPLFMVIWWPMSLFFYWNKLKTGKPMGLAYSIASFCLIVGLMCFMNFTYSPHVIWFVYPAFAVIWWPMAMLAHRLRQRGGKDE